MTISQLKWNLRFIREYLLYALRKLTQTKPKFELPESRTYYSSDWPKEK